MDFKKYTAPANFKQLCGEPLQVRRSAGDELIRVHPTHVIPDFAADLWTDRNIFGITLTNWLRGRARSLFR